MGLQHKSVEELETLLELPSTQVLGYFNKTVKRLVEVTTLLRDVINTSVDV